MKDREISSAAATPVDKLQEERRPVREAEISPTYPTSRTSSELSGTSSVAALAVAKHPLKAPTQL
jgi:hypothetical protein